VFENGVGAGSTAHRAKKAASILCRDLALSPRQRPSSHSSTGMAEAGVHRDYISKVLNHGQGGPAATRIYDRYTYDKENRGSLERWECRVEMLTHSDNSASFTPDRIMAHSN
jgi:hypothetical protein